MPFILLLVLALVSMQPQWPMPALGMGELGASVSTWLGVMVFVAAAWIMARKQARGLTSRPEDRATLVHRFTTLRRRHFFLFLAFYLVAIYGLGWGWTVKGSFTFPGVELVILTPLLLGLMATWAAFYRADRQANDLVADQDAPTFPGLISYVFLQTRHNFLLMVPPALLLLVQQTLLAVVPDVQANEYIVPASGIALVAVMLVGTPWLLRILLSLSPMPDCPLRTRLTEAAKRLNFRFTDILVWNTRNTVANAMVTGPLPFLRYVVLSDKLIEELTPEEIEAVFGHEAGHIKHNHILLYFVFFLMSTVIIGGVGEVLFLSDAVQTFLEDNSPVLRDWLNSPILAAPRLIGLMALYLFLVFGFLSRRCERQADIYGGRAVSCEALIQALEKVAVLNGMHRKKPGWLASWQHSTIALRVEFLRRLAADPTLESRFQRRLGLVKWGMALAMAAILVLLGTDNIWAALKGKF